MVNARKCKNCNSDVSVLEQFCSHCGSSIGLSHQPEGDDGTKYYNPIQTPGRAKLTMIDSTSSVSGYNLGAQREVVGRTQGDIVFENDEFLSPEHAAFTYTKDGLQLSDYGSLNGTYRREPSRILGEDPMHILVGKQLFRIEAIRLTNAYTTPDETMRFVSPIQDFRFRVVHVLVGGRDGQSICSPNNHVVIGRQACDCTIDYDPYLSPHHVQIKEEGGNIVVRDLGSKNGTFFRIQEDVPLTNGDYLFMGQQIIRVEIND